MAEKQKIIEDKASIEQILEERIFVTKAGTHCCYSLFGNEDAIKEKVASLKSSWLSNNAKVDNVLLVDVSVEKPDEAMLEAAINENAMNAAYTVFWEVWKKIENKLSEQLEAYINNKTNDGSSPLKAADNIKIKAVKNFCKSIRDIGTENANSEEEGKNPWKSHEDVRGNISSIFDRLRRLNIQVILIVENIDNVSACFHKTRIDHNFFMTLFEISPKVFEENPDHPLLTALITSKEKISKVAEIRENEVLVIDFMQGGSRIEDAYIPMKLK